MGAAGELNPETRIRKSDDGGEEDVREEEEGDNDGFLPGPGPGPASGLLSWAPALAVPFTV